MRQSTLRQDFASWKVEIKKRALISRVTWILISLWTVMLVVRVVMVARVLDSLPVQSATKVWQLVRAPSADDLYSGAEVLVARQIYSALQMLCSIFLFAALWYGWKRRNANFDKVWGHFEDAVASDDCP